MALASFGVGFLARPVRAFVSGHVGDRTGRKSTLTLAFLLMGAATAANRAVPHLPERRLLGPVLLCVLGLTQESPSAANGGGAAIIAVENASKGRLTVS